MSKLNYVLKNLKQEYVETAGADAYNCNFLTNETIWNSRLYKFIKDMPKGSESHVHGLALLPAAELVDFVKNNDELLISTDKSTLGLLKQAHEINSPVRGNDGSLEISTNTQDFVPLKDAFAAGIYTTDELIKMWSLDGWDNKSDVWDYFEKLFDAHMALGEGPNVVIDYYERAFEYYYSLNIKLVELKVFLFGDQAGALEKAKMYREAYYRVKKKHPDFKVTLIAMGLKRVDIPIEVVNMLVDNTIYVSKKLMDESDKDNIVPMFKAFDFVNEEDKSRPLVELRDQVNKIKKENPNLKFTHHAGETLLADSNNVIEAYNMGCARVGHGFNLYKFPELKEKFIRDEIVLEVCPVSNNILGYCDDLSHHPAKNYYKEGVKIIIGSDDPSYEEHTSVVDDYFAITINWDLDINQLKALARQSIEFSLLDYKNKEEALETFEKDWEKFENKCLENWNK